ncbi:hypothetical protein [Chryseobacterium sp. SC28]|uniref:hypothetical protein n=1 Tax=Chryseobacterium sp. SC28 TaxID=2268028 RepID=UPI000F650849|nr:hypothetical protein [Chryseobacterium sp. SC28]RRQ46499.1 hypothetical protein DTW91_04790 [Chryseobacterium sp. SC28]
MRKIYNLLFIITSITLLKSQATIGGGGQTVPSVSSFSSYINSPVSLTTGIPDISFPLMGLPTNSKDITISMALAYHPTNLKSDQPASEVGAGWSLFSGGVISRDVVNVPDHLEDENSNNTPNYTPNPDYFLSDVYYYNFSGYSGKFRIEKNGTGGFKAIMLTPSALRVEFTGTAYTNYQDFTSFTITDDRGYKYVFSDFATSFYPVSPQAKYIYKSAFYLNKIISPSGQDIVIFHNHLYTEPLAQYPYSSLSTQLYKLESIESIGNGTIDISYTYTQNSGNTYNDPYRINTIKLKDRNGNIISQYALDYTDISHRFKNVLGENQTVVKRALWKLRKLDKNSGLIETTKFGYEYYGYGEYGAIPGQYGASFLLNPGTEHEAYWNPKYDTKGLLKTIMLPTGGIKEYLFGVNQKFEDRNTQQFINNIKNTQSVSYPDLQYLTNFNSFQVDTNQSRFYTIHVSKTTGIYIRFITTEIYPQESNYPPPSLYFQLKKNGTVINGNKSELPGYTVTYYYLNPGDYTMQLYGTGGTADVECYQIDYLPPPYKNARTVEDSGLRIQTINYYSGMNDLYMSIPPARTETFEYTLKSDANSSSGTELFTLGDHSVPYINYKNVKTTRETGKGYTWYYYKLFDEFPPTTLIQNTSSFLPYYNLVNNGLLTKKENYNAQNQKISDENFEPVFGELEPQYILHPALSNPYYKTYTKTAYIKEQKITSHIYDASQNSMEHITEIKTNPSNFGISSQKQTLADGSTTENNYQYATEKASQNQHLITANIISLPLESTAKLNGAEVSHTEIKFENPGSLFPTTSLSYAADSSLKDKVTYDRYDSKGNLLQYSTRDGVPTTVIWGYNRTQPIARIEGAKYEDVMTVLGLATSSDAYTGADIVTKSDQDINDATENELRIALETFRKKGLFKNYLITTYTYDPLIGVTSMTSSNGMREFYYYDNANRLQRVENAEHQVVKEYKYNPNSPN